MAIVPRKQYSRLLNHCNSLHTDCRWRAWFHPDAMLTEQAGYLIYRGISSHPSFKQMPAFQTWGNGMRFAVIAVGDSTYQWYAAIDKALLRDDLGGEQRAVASGPLSPHRLIDIDPQRCQDMLLRLFASYHDPISRILQHSDLTSIQANDAYASIRSPPSDLDHISSGLFNPFSRRRVHPSDQLTEPQIPVIFLGDANHTVRRAMTVNLVCQMIMDDVVRSLARARRRSSDRRRSESSWIPCEGVL
jgi:hypothetical protein